MTFKCIDIQDALPIIDIKANIADIRDLISFQNGHMQNAVHLSNDNLEAFVNNNDFETPLIVCCYHGNSSKGAAEYLAAQGFKDVYSLNGGFTQWQALHPERCESES
ncbi:thiosulfate sulfurtransferase [Marinomonas sp. S3726]|uniref:thiosulfate sulfurtransferase GlpE n=1 Tax=Marinomonas sp. S3726 TaxID=579484 RepID=UPI0005F9FF78|nr:thiosulfate sulfurtransferase GlpE [Marinomonas sp. S3726]KJZ14740.1 thiosulfate sulfurtransferase [Marinomonas sp. S3726]